MDNKLKHKIINYLNKNYSGLVRYETDKWKDSIFFMKDGKTIYEYNKKNKNVYLSYHYIWSFLESFIGLKYEEIQDLTKLWVEGQFKSNVETTKRTYQYRINQVEEQFKLDVITTSSSCVKISSWIEILYKLETNE